MNGSQILLVTEKSGNWTQGPGIPKPKAKYLYSSALGLLGLGIPNIF